jgi:hypothetical protein
MMASNRTVEGMVMDSKADHQCDDYNAAKRLPNSRQIMNRQRKMDVVDESIGLR